MAFRVVFTDPHEHQLSDELLLRLKKEGAKFEARLCHDEQETVAFCQEADVVITSRTEITARDPSYGGLPPDCSHRNS